jgi:hypothetical protein
MLVEDKRIVTFKSGNILDLKENVLLDRRHCASVNSGLRMEPRGQWKQTHTQVESISY